MSNYLEIVKTAIVFFPFIAFIFSIPFILLNYHKYGSVSFLKSLLIYSFIFYLICAYFLIILPLPSIEEVSKLTTQRVQLIPFHFIYDFIKEFDMNKLKSIFSIITKSYFYVPIYNIILTIPFAVYIRYYFNTNKKQTVIFTFLLSLFFELTQLTGIYFIYPRGYRLFDIDDLLLNTFGGLIGFYISNLILKVVPSKDVINKKSIQKGIKEVTGFRKFTSFLVDSFIVSIIWYLSSLIFKTKYLFLTVTFIYVFIVPLFFNKRTLAEKFLNIIVVTIDNKVSILNIYIRRVLFFIIYILLPYFICYLYIYLLPYETNKKLKLLILLITIIIIMLIFIISIIKFFFFKSPLIYERISKTKYISTIKGE